MNHKIYTVFVRTWWKKVNGKLTPHPGRKKVIGRRLTIDEARQMCQNWNNSHEPGQLSRKAEFTSNY